MPSPFPRTGKGQQSLRVPTSQPCAKCFAYIFFHNSHIRAGPAATLDSIDEKKEAQ